MVITHKLKMNMEEEVTQRLEMPLGDVSTRSIEMLLYLRQSPWTIPEGVTVLIRYQKPDGTTGEYDTMPDATAAWSVAGNVLTVAVAPQVLTAAGNASLYAEMYLEEKVLHTFAVEISVKAPFVMRRGTGAASQDYYYVTNVLRGPVMAQPGQILAVEEVDAYGRVTKVESMDTADVVNKSGNAVLYTNQLLTATEKAQARANIGALSVPYKTVLQRRLWNDMGLSDFGAEMVAGGVSRYTFCQITPRRDFLDDLDAFDFTLTMELNGNSYTLEKADCTVTDNGTDENRHWIVSHAVMEGALFEIEQAESYTCINFGDYLPDSWNLKLYSLVEEQVEVPFVATVNGTEPDKYGNVEIPMEEKPAVLYGQQALTDQQKAQARENIGVAAANTVFEATNQALFTNMLTAAGIEQGKMLASDGTVVAANSMVVTGYIPVKAGQIIRVNEDFALFTGDNEPKVVVYDAACTKLTHMNNSGMVEGGYYVELLEKNSDGNIVSFRVNRPAAAAFIRISNRAAVVGNDPALTVDEEIRYEYGYGEKLNPRIKVDYSQITNPPQRNGWSILPNERLSVAYSSIGRKPINTLEHFTDAAENYGYNALKADVRPTADGELICCHDAGFTFDENGHIARYDSDNATMIRSISAETALGYTFSTGEHPCLVGDYLEVCRKYGKVAFVTIRNEYMDVVIPKLIAELKKHNMLQSTIINSMTYDSLVLWRTYDTSVMLNYTLSFGVAVENAHIDKAVSLGYCSLCGFSLSSAATDPGAGCVFDYAREKGIRLLQAIAYKEGSAEACFGLGYDGCVIGIAWNPKPETDTAEIVDAVLAALPVYSGEVEEV